MAERELRIKGAAEKLAEKGRILVKEGGRQIAVFQGEKGIFACNNKCPHEGYPLSEGTLTEGCVLTCNWHNWKFDLESGETMVGGDQVRTYPARLDGGDLLLNVSDPSPEQAIGKALDNLLDCFDDHEYDRMAREIARLVKAGGDPLDALRRTIHWTHDRMEFGATHAYGAALDWLTLRDRYGADDEALALIPVVEVVAHMAWDTRREKIYPYPVKLVDFTVDGFVRAVDAEDEETAIGMIRGGLACGMTHRDFEEALTRAALDHFLDFGHSLIYVYKTMGLIDRLGADVAEPLLLALVRSLIYGRREDLIPEFRAYAPALQSWGQATWDDEPVVWDELTGRSVAKVLERMQASSSNTAALFDAALGALAWNMLHFDEAHQFHTDRNVAANQSFLSFTHGLTFANAVHVQCSRFPELWPQGLLQMGCFIGRNAGFVDKGYVADRWYLSDPRAFFAEVEHGFFDHAQFEYIVACHLVKTTAAIREEYEASPGGPAAQMLLAAGNRFLNATLKRKHVLRTARQALSFVANEG